MPEVVRWGDRVFIQVVTPSLPVQPELERGPFKAVWPYREVFAVVSLTRSPGIEICGFCGETSEAVARGAVKTCSARGDKRPHAWRSVRNDELSGPGVAKDTGEQMLSSKAREKGGAEFPIPPVDRSARCTVGEAVSPGIANTEDRGDGQQKGYVILCDEERRKGFVRPVRYSYIHKKCGAKTTMGLALSETYARDPSFYSGTFCCQCGSHFPVGADGEFTWEDGTKVGT
jgi:hypothetical protein